MDEFESWNDYGIFAHKVKRIARHILDEKSQRFLSTLLETSKKRKGTAKNGAALWRAQLGHIWRVEGAGTEYEFEVEAALNSERMAPFSDRATEGRVNPKGIPCLYLATDLETAIGEVRPGVGSYVSAGQFKVMRDVTLVDCSTDPRPRMFYRDDGEDTDPAAREVEVWARVNEAFSEPVTPSDNIADYAPTQVLAEAFHNYGYEGIVYQSRIGSGKNIALFDLKSAELDNCRLYRVDSAQYHFNQMDNGYYAIELYTGIKTDYYPQVIAEPSEDE